METGISEIKIPSTVKEMGQSAFEDCKKLKKITMPGDFKLKFRKGECQRECVIFGKNNVTVKFNTQLNIEIVTYLYAYNLIPSKNDKNYKAIKGVIYTKDGKGIVRVPAARKKLIIENDVQNLTFNLLCIVHLVADVIK